MTQDKMEIVRLHMRDNYDVAPWEWDNEELELAIYDLITKNQAKNNEVLDLVSGCFPTNEEIEKFGDIFCEEENFKPNTTFSFKDGMKKCIDIIKKNINNR